MTLALLFPGQGTQHAAMLSWVDNQPEAAALLQRVSAELGPGWRARLNDAEWATQNVVAQCLLTGLSLAAWQCLRGLLPMPAVVAGYSVGELPAYCAAGVFDAGQALALARQRAEAMDRSVAGQPAGGLLALQGGRPERIAALRLRHGLALAIRMAPDRCVLGGAQAALAAALPELDRAGAHCTLLAVRIASHTPQLAAAAEEFAQRLAALPFTRPQAWLVMNVDGAASRDTARLKQALSAQIASPVQWDRCQHSVAERGVRCVLEVGPGSSLSKLWNAEHPEAPARSIDEFHSPEAVRRWVLATLV